MSQIPVLEAHDRAALDAFAPSGWNPEGDVVASVGRIIADVRQRGDAALVDYARRFDDPAFVPDRLRVALPPLQKARSLVPADVAAGLELARARVQAFHERQRSADLEYDESDGTRYAMITRPLASVGAYVPGGTASLPSSVVMTVVPAKVAGVARIAVATPPSRDGGVNPAILFACALCGADEVYAVGGAQAIAALAYGTRTIAAVDKIVGPGNVWVTEAKRQVFGKVGIDGLAGPSEVLVVADDRARAEFVAGEMLAQAEHDPRSRVAAVSTSRSLLDEVGRLLEAARASGKRGEIVEQVLDNATWLIHAVSEDEMLEVAERFAPEHLSVQMRDPMSFARRVRQSGAVFAGDWTPVAVGDYIAGTNHVLPTAGAARFASGLRLADFTRSISIVEYSRERMAADAGVLESLAEFEGLPAHARTASMRKQ